MWLGFTLEFENRDVRQGTHTVLKILAPNVDENNVQVFLEDAKQAKALF